jgi:hypothetical protein
MFYCTPFHRRRSGVRPLGRNASVGSLDCMSPRDRVSSGALSHYQDTYATVSLLAALCCHSALVYFMSSVTLYRLCSARASVMLLEQYV